jgi:hypothetical protein
MRPDQGGMHPHAGFLPNGAKRGLGIMLDCIRPIMTEKGREARKQISEIETGGMFVDRRNDFRK